MPRHPPSLAATHIKPTLLITNSPPHPTVVEPFLASHSLLWHHISALLKPQEHHVVKTAVGSSLIDANEVLYREALALEEILQSVKEDTHQKLVSHRLLDTPARRLLEGEIRILAQSLCRNTSARNDPGGILPSSAVEASEQPVRRHPVAVRKPNGDGVPQETKALQRQKRFQGEHGRAAMKIDARKSWQSRNLQNIRRSVQRLDFSVAEQPIEPDQISGLDRKIQQKKVPSERLEGNRTLDYVICKGLIQEQDRLACSKALSSSLSTSHNEQDSQSRKEPDVGVPSRAFPAYSTPTALVEFLAPSLNAYDIDGVADQLREAFAREHVYSKPSRIYFHVL